MGCFDELVVKFEALSSLDMCFVGFWLIGDMGMLDLDLISTSLIFMLKLVG